MCAKDHVKAIRAARVLDTQIRIAKGQAAIRAAAAQLRDGGMAKEPPPWIPCS